MENTSSMSQDLKDYPPPKIGVANSLDAASHISTSRI
jgi:hypothetical protein